MKGGFFRSPPLSSFFGVTRGSSSSARSAWFYALALMNERERGVGGDLAVGIFGF